MNRNDLCWCGSGKKYKKCHEDFDERIASIRYDVIKGQVRPPRKIINNEADIAGIRRAAVINDAVLDLMGTLVAPGVDTETLDRAAHEYIVSHGGIPACLGFEGFPKSICTSINNVVCHGIPSTKDVLKEGDIINVDSTVIVDGYYADASRMYLIGKVPAEAERIVKVQKECMESGIAEARTWHFIGDVSAA